MEKLVSIIMPVCNNEKYLAESIESVLNQTYKNIEILILNDGSCDKSLSIIENYAMHNKSIRIISRDNKGISSSVRELLKYANGDYIARMNGDDVSYPNRIEIQVKFLNENPEIFLVGSYVDIELTDYKNDDDKKLCEKIFNFKAAGDDAIVKILNGNKICHGTFCMKSKLFESINYDLNLKHAEDVDFILNLKSKNFKFDVIPKKLYLNRINSEFVHKQKQLNENYNQELLASKIKFLENKFIGREIIIFGKSKYLKILERILENRFKITLIEKCLDISSFKNHYFIILDKENCEDIEGKLMLSGRRVLEDFINLCF